MSKKKKFLFLLCSPFALQLGYSGTATPGIPSAPMVPPSPPKATTEATFYTPFLTDASAPLFTGPLLAPSVHTIPQGHYDIEPYLFFFAITGAYNQNWNSQSNPNYYNLNLLLPAWVGLTPWLDCTLQLQGFYQFTQGERSVQFGDIPFGFNIQLLNEQPGTWWPAIKLGLKANIPTGKYDHLNPNKLGTDIGGSGSWQPSATLSVGRLFQVAATHFLSPRLGFSYTVPNPVGVKDLSIYGGTKGTNGTGYQGNFYYVDLGLEYNVARHWALACDFYYQHNNKSRFSGNPGYNADGSPASVGAPSAEQFSLAPALEYNWSPYIGIIGGVWFSIGGRNTARFATGTVAFNVYI
jgi:hypothetical protein